jgi:hypothetical protein
MIEQVYSFNRIQSSFHARRSMAAKCRQAIIGERVSLSELLPADDILYMVRGCVHSIV